MLFKSILNASEKLQPRMNGNADTTKAAQYQSDCQMDTDIASPSLSLEAVQYQADNDRLWLKCFND